MNSKISGEYWMYLRKSRADIEAEARGEGETLAKHRNALHKLAADRQYMITRIYQETVSGESIIHRPEMVKLLQDLESSPPLGVLVMDIDRLGRGDKIDQGIIERAFKESGSLIITPAETYDMNNEAGEFGVEVRSFLARMELKQITKRMQGGRVRSVENGNYIGTRPPYGYELLNDDKGRTLSPHPIQADVVKMIFDWYTHDDPKQRMGSSKIATQLQSMRFRTYTGRAWEASTVLSIIKNAVYTGKVEWKKKESKKSNQPGKRREVKLRPQEDWISVVGRHEPLISEDTYNKAQEILKGKYHVPYQLENGITNPLAGLIRCGYCGSSMVYRPYVNADGHIKCTNRACKCKSSKFIYVEQHLFQALHNWLSNYKSISEFKPNEVTATKTFTSLLPDQIKELDKERSTLEQQKSKLHDLLETGVYDVDTYLARNKDLLDRINANEMAISQLRKNYDLELKRQQAREEIIPKIEKAMESYHQTGDPAAKNAILKSVIENCLYKKEKHQKNDEFELIVFPRLPK